MNQVVKGFTLIELLVALALLSVLLGVAVPAMQNLQEDLQLSSAASSLSASLILARSESIMRNVPVIIDNTDGEWSTGWRIFADGNRNGALDVGEATLASYPALPSSLTGTGNSPVQNYVRYTPTGRTRLIGGAFQAGTITLCATSDDLSGRKVIISSSGRPRVQRGNADDC